MFTVRFVKLSNYAYEPVKGSTNSAGFDLRSPHYYVLPPHSKILIPTDLAFQIPKYTYGRIAPRSGLANNNFIDVGAGVIDRDYTGNVSVLLFNHSDIPFVINRNDKIAQIIFEKILEPDMVETKFIDQTDRGGSGFGSTDRI